MKGNLTSTDCREQSLLDALAQGPLVDPANEMEGCCSAPADNFEVAADRELEAAGMELAAADRELGTEE